MKKCPYCAEEIQDEAIFCRYCRRDLKQASDEVRQSGDDGEVQQPKDQDVQHPKDQADSSTMHVVASLRWGQITLAVLVPAIVDILGQLYVLTLHQIPVDLITSTHLLLYYTILLAWLLTSIACGFWAGILWHRRDLTAYVVLALVEGSLTILIDSFVEWVSLFGFLSPVLLFLSGALYADRRKKRSLPPSAREGRYTKVLSPTTISLIEKLGPAAITLLGTIITVLAK